MWRKIECRIQSTQEWVDESLRVPLDEDAIRCFGVGSEIIDGEPTFSFYYEDWGNPNGWNEQKTENARVYVQENLIDTRELLSDLPDSHPYKFVDPAQPDLFHEVWTPPGGVEDTYLVTRPAVMYSLFYENGAGLHWRIGVPGLDS